MKLIFHKLLKKFRVFHGTRQFVTNVPKNPTLGQILSRIHPVHVLTSHLFEVHFKNILSFIYIHLPSGLFPIYVLKLLYFV
jgi:hypothetical protein